MSCGSQVDSRVGSQVGSHKTNILFKNGSTIVIYRNTEIVIFTDVSITLNNGGHLTKTTKTRMNQVSREFNLDYRVYQCQYRWYIKHKGENILFQGHSVTLKR